MTTEIRAPKIDELADLRALWRVAFGDTDEEIARFFDTAFSQRRARCLYCDGELAAMLYWFDTEANGAKIAYLYAIATAPRFRRLGFCSALLRDTHAHLASLGYEGAALVPALPALFDFYATLGYHMLCEIREGDCLAGEEALTLSTLDASEYARLRRIHLPLGGLIQEGACLAYLASFAEFYTGDGLLISLSRNGDTVHIHELLGDAKGASAVAAALHARRAFFRAPGEGKPFAMYLAFGNAPAPTYLGLALD